jgi:Spy/CpxP family protein refolding chaperone
MKKLGVLFIVLLFACGITFSQERGGGERPSKTMGPGNRGGRPQMTPEQRLERQTKSLVDGLKLDKAQEAKVLAINKKYMDKQTMDWSKMRDATDEERTKMRESMQKIQAEKDKEIKAVLTESQIKLYDEMQKKREEMRRNGQGRMGGQGGQGQ